MKKIIAISVMFVLLTGAAFAVDLGGYVAGTTTLFSGQSGDGADDEILSSGKFFSYRIHGSGESEDGKFGGYYRWDGGPHGNVWWKPIDQFKLMIGSNGYDGFIGKEGVTGWGFHQTIMDTGVSTSDGGAGVWDADIYGMGIKYRDAFFEGHGDGVPNRTYLFITPVDMVAINVILDTFSDLETADVFKSAVFQADLNFDFGNIALTYAGAEDAGDIYFYYGGSFGDLGLDIGFHYNLADGAPMGVGLGLKYSADAFSLKFRTVAVLGGDPKDTNIMAEVMPYFSLADNLTAFVSLGLGVAMPDGGDTAVGWSFNPYLQVGEEWGAKFAVGVKVWAEAKEKALLNWAVPIGMLISF